MEALGRGKQVEGAGGGQLARDQPGQGGGGVGGLGGGGRGSRQPHDEALIYVTEAGMDTERHLVRNCIICGMALLGRNALGQHLENVHRKVFGPYRCSQPGCGKLVESGTKMVSGW